MEDDHTLAKAFMSSGTGPKRPRALTDCTGDQEVDSWSQMSHPQACPQDPWTTWPAYSCPANHNWARSVGPGQHAVILSIVPGPAA